MYGQTSGGATVGVDVDLEIDVAVIAVIAVAVDPVDVGVFR